MKRYLLAALVGGALAQPLMATETVAYSYDELGRLVRVSHAGSVNNGRITTYSYDAADNRVSVATTGA